MSLGVNWAEISPASTQRVDGPTISEGMAIQDLLHGYVVELTDSDLAMLQSFASHLVPQSWWLGRKQDQTGQGCETAHDYNEHC